MTHQIATREDWTAARVALLEQEKAATRARDAMAEARRALPWVEVTEPYAFDGPDGRETLTDLFAGRGQLLIYHFMFGSDWNEPCPSCSFWADNMSGVDVHLAARDTTLIMASTAPFEMLEEVRNRMGWRIKWVSSGASRFNQDFEVTFSAEELEAGTHSYNYRKAGFGGPEAPGMSAFRKENGKVYHTYSTFGRGLDGFNGAYQMLDLTSKGRDEDDLPYGMAWLKRRDEY